jgi:hypothetical protein
MTSLAAHSIGQRAESRVFDALATLPSPWQFYPTVEWRALRNDGEVVGEADVVVFHPQHGLIVFEIKAGAVDVRNGEWFYASGLPMKLSPFAQARRNRYALLEKLRQRLSAKAVDSLTVTHAAWFPDLLWHSALPGTEAPSRDFLFDRSTLADPESALLRLFRAAAPAAQAWSRSQQQALKELLAPDCHLLVPLASRLDDAVATLQQATQQQISVLRLLRSQLRLLVEGGAGSGKTLLAVTLAREHAALGKSVLLTCFNRNLAQQLAATLDGVPGITVLHFHELVRHMALAVGLEFVVPPEAEARSHFFREDCAELLLSAAELGAGTFDTLIVDEAADFASTWWIALEALGAVGFSWYCFYDRHQSLYPFSSPSGNTWLPPFSAEPMNLEANLRNTRPIGELAAQLGQCPLPQEFRVRDGEAPTILISHDFGEMAVQLRQLLRMLLRKEGVTPERLVVLAPYRHTNAQSGWAAGLDEVQVSTQMAESPVGQVRVGTIQGFKGLEADVVILAGIDGAAGKHPEWLYVGASRARAALFILALDKAAIRQGA